MSERPISAQTLREFSELKKRADNKYLEARQEWLNTKDKITGNPK
ncbi:MULTISPECIES: hypothetical protein [unclassified Pseudomonas]|nr:MULTISPECIES: hypothetical protein [unclassified Pseudomonas]